MKWQLDGLRRKIIDHPARFKVVVAGRRWGKTHLALMWLLAGSILKESKLWYIAPTYRQGKMIAFPLLRQIFRGRLDGSVNESNLSITLNNGAEISIKGADNEDNLRGVGLTRAVVDEVDYMKPHVIPEILMPMMADKQAPAMFIGTPDSYKQLYEYYNKGQSNDPEWMSWQFKTIDSGYVETQEIEKLKSRMDERVFRQEMEASFETVGNRAAYNFDRNVNVKDTDDLSSTKWVGIDFNVDYMSAVAVCEYTDGTVHYYDEIRLANSNTTEMAKAMRDKWNGIVEVYPDPAGKARSTTSSVSDHDILRDFGYQVIARKAHPSHRDRINALNAKLLNAKDEVKMTVSPSCIELIKDLELCQRDKNGGLDKSDIKRTHSFDAATYGLEYRHPIHKPETRTFIV